MDLNLKLGSNTPKKDPVLAAILSIIPGLGQIYCGRILRGIGFFIASMVLSFVFIGFLIWVLNIYDSYKLAKTGSGIF